MKSQLPFDSLSTELQSEKSESSQSSWKKQHKNSLILLGVAFILLLGVAIAQYKSDQQKKSAIEQGAIALAALSVAGSAWFTSNLGKSLAKPINRLQRLSQELSKGNYQVRTDLQGEGEIEVLAGQLNNLAQTLETRNKKMQQRTELLSQLVDLSCTDIWSGKSEGRENNAQKIEERLSKLLSQCRSMIGAQKIYLYQGKETDIIAQSVSNEPINDAAQTPQIISTNNGGLIIVGAKTWSEAEKNFLEKLAKQIGQILNQLRDRQDKERESQLSLELKNLTLKIASTLEQEKALFDLVCKEAREDLASDRVIVYKFDETWKGQIIAEYVLEGYPRAIRAVINDPCFAANYVEKYKKGRIQATADIHKAGLTECHLQQLEPFKVKANLVAPILSEGKLYGLLITHQCSGPRNWQKAEKDYFTQLASQLGVALERVQVGEQQKQTLTQQRQVKEILQQNVRTLLKAVEPASTGDLTKQATVSDDEVGTIAQSYNQTLGNIRAILNHVKTTTELLDRTSKENKQKINHLAEEAKGQYQELQTAVKQVQNMENSIEKVQESAQEAFNTAREAQIILETGESNMNQTVEGIQSIRETVIETAKKVETLGEASEKISKVVNLISQFAAQTHILALKASIEAARAGEEGESFAVIADEVRSLAAQSAEASGEIETLVGNIQIQTQEVIRAMETGTQQVTSGTRLAETTRINLQKISLASNQITHLVENITQATQEQRQTSSSMTKVIQRVASTAQKTASSANEVTEQVENLLTVVSDLQLDVNQFKV